MLHLVEDLLIYGQSIEEVYELVAWVLEKSKEAGLKFNLEKRIEMQVGNHQKNGRAGRKTKSGH